MLSWYESLMANSMHGSSCSQLLCVGSIKCLNMSSRTLFTLSVLPSVWGWYAELSAWVTPKRANKACHNLLVKRGSLSDTNSRGKPWCLNTLSKKMSARFSALTSSVHGAKCTILDRRSTNTTMAVAPEAVLGKDVMRSRLTEDQVSSGICSGLSKP